MKEFKENFSEACKPKLDKVALSYFDQLVLYIDTAIKDSCKKEGDDRVDALVGHLLQIRDFLSRSVTENSLRQALLRQAIGIIDQIENPPQPLDSKKNIEEPLTETNQKVEKDQVRDL